MRDETREEIVKEVEKRIKTMVKELLEALSPYEGRAGDLPGKPPHQG